MNQQPQACKEYRVEFDPVKPGVDTGLENRCLGYERRRQCDGQRDVNAMATSIFEQLHSARSE